MACPYFMPVGRLDPGRWTHSPRLPLGDPYRGVCHSDPSALFEPSEEDQRGLCNYGYARGRCGRFPSGSGSDAVRFSVTEDDGGRMRLVYILEKNHAPASHGSLEIEPGQAHAIRVPIDEICTRQARAFLESYLRRKEQQ